jgi:hypothetical protein
MNNSNNEELIAALTYKNQIALLLIKDVGSMANPVSHYIWTEIYRDIALPQTMYNFLEGFSWFEDDRGGRPYIDKIQAQQSLDVLCEKFKIDKIKIGE